MYVLEDNCKVEIIMMNSGDEAVQAKTSSTTNGGGIATYCHNKKRCNCLFCFFVLGVSVIGSTLLIPLQ